MGSASGRPLSPLLFNHIIDWVLNEIDPQVGVTLEGSLRLNHLAFADDVSLLSEENEAALRVSKQFGSGLSEVDLLRNAQSPLL